MCVTNGFPPVTGPDVKVLVLGTLPSQQSLQKNQYYGHPQNAFWRIMGALLGAGPELPYAERTKLLTSKGVAIWDVLASSVRPGSMDSAIDEKTAAANDFTGLLGESSDIRLVCFNGQAAAKLFDRFVRQNIRDSSCETKFVTMPSTSPAYAAMSFAEKLDRWSAITAALEQPDLG